MVVEKSSESNPASGVATLISHQGKQRNRFNQPILKALVHAHLGKPGCREE